MTGGTPKKFANGSNRTGQFWSIQGDEALMCLETFWRNNRWHDLFPHAKPPPLANN